MFSKENFINNSKSNQSLIVLQNQDGSPSYTLNTSSITKVERVRNLLKVNIRNGEDVVYKLLEFESSAEASEALNALNARLNSAQNVNYDYKGSHSPGIKNHIEKNESIDIKPKFQYQVIDGFTIDGDVHVNGELHIVFPEKQAYERNHIPSYKYEQLYDLANSNKLITGSLYKLMDYSTYNLEYHSVFVKKSEPYFWSFENELFEVSFSFELSFIGQKDLNKIWSGTPENISYDIRLNDSFDETYITKSLEVINNAVYFRLIFEGAVSGFILIRDVECKLGEDTRVTGKNMDEVYMELEFYYKPKFDYVEFPIIECDKIGDFACDNQLLLKTQEEYESIQENKDILKFYTTKGIWKNIPSKYPNCKYEGLILQANSSNSFSKITSSQLHDCDIILYDFKANAKNPKGEIIYRKDPIHNIETPFDFRYIRHERWLDANNYPSLTSPTFYMCIEELDFSNGFKANHLETTTGNIMLDITLYSPEDLVSVFIDHFPHTYLVDNKIYISSQNREIVRLYGILYDSEMNEEEVFYDFSIRTSAHYFTFMAEAANIQLASGSKGVIFLSSAQDVYAKRDWDNSVLTGQINELETLKEINNVVFGNIQNVRIERELSNRNILDDLTNGIIEDARTPIAV